MGRTRDLLTPAVVIAAAAVMTVAIGGGAAQAAPGDCGGPRVLTGGCNSVRPGITGEGVALHGETRHGGSAGGQAGRGTLGSPPNRGRRAGSSRDLIGGRRFGDSCSPEAGCGDVVRPGVAPVGESFEASVPGVTIADVASFAPVAPRDAMEPGPGIAVRRLPANFISAATTQVVDGVVLDRPAAVRFTPVGFSWATGDGGRVEASTSGASWARLGVRELTDTATSHRYAERGRYDVQPVVTYAAEYRFDASGWVPIEGTLDVTGETFPVRVVTVETRLVRGDCLQYPHDPGCE